MKDSVGGLRILSESRGEIQEGQLVFSVEGTHTYTMEAMGRKAEMSGRNSNRFFLMNEQFPSEDDGKEDDDDDYDDDDDDDGT